MIQAIMRQSNLYDLSEYDIFDRGDLDLCYYCGGPFPKGSLTQIIKDPADWDDGLTLACPFCADQHAEEQKAWAWEVMLDFLAG